jgi:hypothetical protein
MTGFRSMLWPTRARRTPAAPAQRAIGAPRRRRELGAAPTAPVPAPRPPADRKPLVGAGPAALPDRRQAVLSFFLPAGPEAANFYEALGAGVEDHAPIDFGELEPVWRGSTSVGRTAEERAADYETELEAAVQAEIEAERAADFEIVPNLEVEVEAELAAPIRVRAEREPNGGALEIAASAGPDELFGEYWTPTPDGSYVDDSGPESGYGWPVSAGRPTAVPAYPPVSWFGPATTAVVHVDDLDPARESEPMGVVLQWPPTRPSASNELPRSWSYRPAEASVGRASLSRWAMSDGARNRPDGRTIYQGQGGQSGQHEHGGLSLVDGRAGEQPREPGSRANRGGRIYYGGNSRRARADIEGYERISESLNRPSRRSRPNPLAEADANTTVYLSRHSAEPR